MPKIAPTTNEQQDLLHKDTSSTAADIVLPKKKVFFGGCFSMRIVIILLIISLLFLCSLFIWLASFIGSRTAVNELTTNLIDQVGRKILVFLESQIAPSSGLAKSIASDFKLGIIERRPPLSYLFEKNNIYRPSSVGVFYPTEMYGYFNLTFFTKGYPEETFTVYIKQRDSVGIEQWNASVTTGALLDIVVNQTTPLVISNLAYWKTSIKYFDLYGVDGVYGDPYVVINSTTCIYYSAKLLDPIALTRNNTKKVVGIAKVNLSLSEIESYLHNLKIYERGYVLVSETNDLVIGGSINTTALDKVSRVPLFNLTDKDSGILMSQIKTKYSGVSNSPSTFEISSLGVDYYISRMEFKLENIVWNVFLVVYSEDVSKTVNINTAISVGVAVFVMIIGLMTSVMIGYMITEPLKYLEKQFMKIKKFDLTSVHFTSSRFKEIDIMYEDLHEMVVWLNEFKSFLPESIFNQLRNMENLSETGEETEPQKKIDVRSSEQIKKSTNIRESKDGLESSSRHSSSHDGSFRNNTEGRTSLFKLGLSEKEASIILVKIPGMCKNLSTVEISQLFSKIASGLSALSKTMQADLQIISIDQYQISFATGKKKSNIQALEAALKISKSLSSFLSDYEKLSICIGITTGKANVGNLGTNSLRFYSIVGPLLSNAEKLCALSQHYNIQILADSKTLENGAKTLFVSRPIERFEIDNEIFLPNISTIYQIIKENSFSKDEWMYELEQQKENVKYKNFENAFSVFESLDSNSSSASLVEKVNQSKSLLYEHLEKCPEDSQITNNVLNCLDVLFTKVYSGNIELRSGLLNYRARIDQSMSKVTQDSTFNTVEIINPQPCK